jgi:hypothetical protein
MVSHLCLGNLEGDPSISTSLLYFPGMTDVATPEIGSCELLAQAGLEPILLISTTQVAGITGVSYCGRSKLTPYLS